MSTLKIIAEKEAMLDKALSSPDAARVKTIAKSFGVAKMIPETVKTNLQTVIDLSKTLQKEAPEVVLAYSKLATKTVVGICGIIGIEVK